MTVAWLQYDASGNLVLSLHIQPGARKTGFAGVHGNALKIRLAAPPVDGKANAALLAFIAEELGVPRSRVELVSGAASRTKRLRISGVPGEAIARLIAQAA